MKRAFAERSTGSAPTGILRRNQVAIRHFQRADFARSLKIALDCAPLLDPPTGVGRYVAELAAALEARNVDLARYAVALRGENPGNIARARLPARVAHVFWKRSTWPSVEKLTGSPDVVHATNFVLPALRSAAGVVTVHDLSFLRTDVFPGGERLRDLVPWSIARAARVIAPTQAIADEIEERYAVPPEKLAVTHEGVSSLFFGASPLSDTVLGRMGIPGPFVIAAGTIEPRKNLRRLLDAWSHVGSDLEGWTLVLAGPKGWGPDLPETPGVILTGWVEDETLPGLYAAAEFFCYPSLYEGFGLPPLEAMAAGSPVLVGNYPAASEVLGDAALVVDPLDTEALTEGLRRLGTDPALRKRLQLAGRARATGFRWEDTAKATIEVYRSVLQ